MDWLAFAFYRLVSFVLGGLPLPLVFRLGQGIGTICYYVLAPYRQLALRNLEIAFGAGKPPAERRRIARAHFGYLGGNLLSGTVLSRWSPEQLLSVVEVEGLEHMRSVQAQGRGTLMVVTHYGNWELLSQMSPLTLGCPTGTVFQQLGNPYFDRDIRQQRARLGLALFERKEGFQGAIKMLRAGGAVGVLVDQHAGDAGYWCPFFGRLASTSPLAATMALRANAMLVEIHVTAIGAGRWRMTIAPPVEPKGLSVEALTVKQNQLVEALIRQAPEQWFWVHNRWKLPRPKFLLASYKRGGVARPAPGEPPLQPFRVVVRASNWLGDAVMSVPSVRAIKHGRADLHLAVLTPAKLAQLWENVPEVDEVIAIPPNRKGVWAVSRELKQRRFEVAIILPNSLRTALEPWLARIPRRVGYAGHRPRWLLNQVFKRKHKRSVAPAPEHQVHHYRRLVESIGGQVDPHAMLERPAMARPAGAPRRIAVCPGAEYGPAKRWYPARFHAAMQEVSTTHPCTWVLVGVAKDQPIGEELLAGFTGEVENLLGKTSLTELIEVLRGCDLLLTNDTGTMHLAALLGVPTVSIFGSTEHSLTGPLGRGHRVLRHHVACSPCFLRECPLDFRCMKRVTSVEAAAAVREVLAR